MNSIIADFGGIYLMASSFLFALNFSSNPDTWCIRTYIDTAFRKIRAETHKGLPHTVSILLKQIGSLKLKTDSSPACYTIEQAKEVADNITAKCALILRACSHVCSIYTGVSLIYLLIHQILFKNFLNSYFYQVQLGSI